MRISPAVLSLALAGALPRALAAQVEVTPFVGSYSEIMVAHLERAPEPPTSLRPGLPPALEHVILAMLSKAPRARPASMAEVADHLTELALEMPADARELTTGAAAANDDFWADDDWATS